MEAPLSEQLMGVLHGINDANRTGWTLSPHKVVELVYHAKRLEAEIINLKKELDETRSRP
jgi:hypothetical protein